VLSVSDVGLISVVEIKLAKKQSVVKCILAS
jgi:hypothetical protein